MGRELQTVVQRLELGFPILALQRGFDQQIGKGRIFRQQGTVAVGAEDIFVMCALCLVLAVVAKACQNLPL